LFLKEHVASCSISIEKVTPRCPTVNHDCGVFLRLGIFSKHKRLADTDRLSVEGPPVESRWILDSQPLVYSGFCDTIASRSIANSSWGIIKSRLIC